MSWGGVWNLRYKGQNPKRFLDLCKIVIPNYQRRFEVLDENEIEAVKRISWYSADKDLAEIMKLLGENDSIDVIIDGETHPYDENEEELPSFIQFVLSAFCKTYVICYCSIISC